MSRRALVVFALLAACGGAQPAPPVREDPGTGFPGMGITGCKIGDPLETCEATLGAPTRKDAGFAQFSERGVAVNLHDGRVRSVVLLYHRAKGPDFAGNVDRGITVASTPDDVEKAYGRPAKIMNEVHGNAPTELVYAYPRVWFAFVDGKLVRVTLKAD